MVNDPAVVRFVKRILQWGLPAKLALTAVIGVISGGFLGHLAEYATYNYAIHYGFRAPIEGIPYLRAAVTFGSFFLLFTGAVVFAVVWLGLKSLLAPRIFMELFLPAETRNRLLASSWVWGWVKKEVEAIGQPTWAERVPGKTWPRAISIAIALSVSVPYICVVVLTLIADQPAPEGALAAFYAVLFPYIFALAIVLMKPKAIVGVASAATVAYFIAAVYFLWAPTSHAQMLRHLGYGGGLPVQIDFDDGTTLPKNSREKIYLMSRTTEAYILFDPTSDRFLEFPRASVQQISTKSNRDKWDFRLPEREDLYP